MALARDLSSRTSPALLQRCALVHDALVRDGLYEGEDFKQAPVGPDAAPRNPDQTVTSWRIAPHPLYLTSGDIAFLQSLGNHLLAFYRALNRLYLDSLRGTQPSWVAAYLDQGKPESLLSYSRMKRWRDHLPAVIRPDIIPTEEGMVITELDSVPGGIGLTGALQQAYGDDAIVGGSDGMVRGFARMMADQLGGASGHAAIVVSEEAKDYRPEMTWLAGRLRDQGLDVSCVEPRQVRFTEEALLAEVDGTDRPIALLYRFFELFDLPNIPKVELIMYAAKKEQVQVTPPFKPALEEKLAFALFHHPVLTPFWTKELKDETYAVLAGLLPRTWILDPRLLPPSAVIPGLEVGGRAVADWRDLAGASQKDRRYVVKPSGFSELAWGSRGVSVGHDLSQTEWAAALERGLASFSSTPYILQEFHKGRQFEVSYYEKRADEVVPMAGRARLSPYYFVAGGQAELAGILGTVCSLEKKLIHGMRDAVMVPCALQQS